MLILCIAIPVYLTGLLAAVGMGFKKGLLFVCFLVGITFLLYLMFFHSNESALGVVTIALLIYLIAKKK